MPNIMNEISAPERLRAELEAVTGVRRAFVDAPESRIYLICDPPDPTVALEAAVESVLERSGISAGSIDLQLTYPLSVAVDRRVRFVEMKLDRSRVGICAGTAVLEWDGRRFEGHAEGEGGGAGEIRTCAQATARALEAVVAGRVPLELLGIKSIRIFDQDLISVILHSPVAPDRRLVGVSLVLHDQPRSASLAVLNATNRLLGSHL
jgi:hypothetical protein